MVGPLRALDTAGGALAGAVTGLAMAWLVAVVGLDQPGLHLRGEVQSSKVLPALLRVVPPASVLDALARFDPLPVIPSLAGRALPPPDPAVLHAPGARRAAGSVVRIHGTACGLGVEGSGWVIRPGIVVTNAHVVAGETDTVAETPGTPALRAVAVSVDPGNDVAVLRVAGLAAPALRMAPADPSGQAVALIGYPLDGPLVAVPGRAGRPVTALSPNAYGRDVRPRSIVPLRGRLEHGDSGGPVVDAHGRVVAMMFAADSAGGGGFGVPLAAIRAALRRARGPVSTGPCIA
jgi:S1-C subfamily serine protease